jgi:polyhydroxyalkanoate synthesis regulator phasin
LDKEVEYHSSKKINESKMKIKFKSKKQALLEEEVQKHLEQVLSEVGSAKSRRKKIEDLEKKIKDLKAKKKIWKTSMMNW